MSNNYSVNNSRFEERVSVFMERAQEAIEYARNEAALRESIRHTGIHVLRRYTEPLSLILPIESIWSMPLWKSAGICIGRGSRT